MLERFPACWPSLSLDFFLYTMDGTWSLPFFRVCAQAHTHTRTCTLRYMHTITHTRTHTRTHSHTRTHTRPHTRTHTRTHMHTPVRTHTRTHAHSLSLSVSLSHTVCTHHGKGSGDQLCECQPFRQASADMLAWGSPCAWSTDPSLLCLPFRRLLRRGCLADSGYPHASAVNRPVQSMWNTSWALLFSSQFEVEDFEEVMLFQLPDS